MDCLLAQNLTVSLHGKKIIEDIYLTVKENEIVGILGVSGVGKTTLFNTLAGIYTPDCGSIILKGRDITGKPGKIRYMLQEDALLPFKKVIDNAALPLLLAGVNKREARKKADSYFKVFGLEGTQKAYPAQLSGGMRQRVAFLRTCLDAQNLILLDEPFSALDAITKKKMHQWFLKVLSKMNLSTIFITHDVDEAVLLSDKIYILGSCPGTIIDSIEIEKAKHTDVDYSLTEEFLAYKKRVLKSFYQEMQRCSF